VCCFTVVSVLFSLSCSKKHELLSFSLVIVMSFVRWRHIIFQYIQINNCDFTLTRKLPWFLLNLVWLCMTNIQAVKLWIVVWPCTMYLQTTQASIAWLTSFFYDVILHCRPLHVRNGLSFAYLWRVFFWEFDPLNVVGHRADHKKALPCVIARNLSHCAWKSDQG